MRKIIFLCALIFININVMHAENYSNKISGKVTDENLNPIEMVYVTLIENKQSVYTDSLGNYTFDNLAKGVYHLTFSRTGYISKAETVKLDSDIVNFNLILTASLIETSTIDVTSSFEAQDVSQSVFSISTLNSRAFIKEREQTLSATISKFPGVNTISTGIGIGKPVIRGLTSNSVIVVHDGVKQESQQWGDEHSPEVSLYDIDRIEILRGPASLIYGADGIGGVINIISSPLLYSEESGKMINYGTFDLSNATVNSEYSGNFIYGMGFKDIGFKGHIGFRNSGNIRTPDGELIVRTLTPGVNDTIRGGVLSNSATKEIEGGFNFGYNGKFGNIEAGFENFGRKIQMHDPDPLSTANQRLDTKQLELKGDFLLSRLIKLESVISYQIHSRKEFESSEDLENNAANLYWYLGTFSTDLMLHNNLKDIISGTIGVSIVNMNNKSQGKEKLIPNYNSTSFGVYALEKYNYKNLTLSGGLRYDTKLLNIKSTIIENDAQGNPEKVINPDDLTFNAISGSFGIVYRPDHRIDIFSNIGRGWRAPSEFELYVDGEHEGTNRIEKGLKTLNPDGTVSPESSLNIDLGIRLKLSSFNMEISLFNNIIDNFIYPSPTGIIDSISNLQIYDIKQDKSTFRGIEYSLQFQPVKFLLVSLSGDYVFTKNNATDNPLPFTPPMKNIIEIKFQKENIFELQNPYISASCRITSPQYDVDPLETVTDGYTLFNMSAGFDIAFSKMIASVDITGNNLFNVRYVDHLSRYKTYALNPGRNISLKLTIPFRI
jgi:iron complex outermembrane receptor protein